MTKTGQHGSFYNAIDLVLVMIIDGLETPVAPISLNRNINILLVHVTCIRYRIMVMDHNYQFVEST